ncbi:MAG TPA: DNA repair protein RecN [Bacillota bacterium]|jgi:DNA repair protein RecN (Recombination protein N)|nr:DNA repair protein RecN [Bacillota bacterium]HOO30529.1 DNA repair protein RecN [Bacillota bacterium]HQD80018.1 DNA repair protein RecN [Bacillota bacterium]
MLSEIDVRNYALIERLSLRFGNGFNVLTGETGAGKSLVIDCVGLVIGGRASSESVRAGCDSAVVEAVFNISDVPDVEALLLEQGIDPEPDGTLIVTREVSRQGRSRCRLNGRIVTLTALSAIGERLVDIYGQHEYQSLARPSRHIGLLDAFGGARLEQVRDSVRQLYEEWRGCEEELAELRQHARERAQRADLLAFQVNEIESANLEPGEDVHLVAEQTVLANAESLYDAVVRAYSLIYESSYPDIASARDMLGEALEELDNASRIDGTLTSLAESLSALCDHTTEISRALREYRDSIEFDPERLAEVEERLSAISRLKRKYGDSLADVIDHGQLAREELESMTGAGRRVDELEGRSAALSEELGNCASKLSAMRCEIAAELEKEVSRELRDLSMPHAVFKVDVGRKRDGHEIVVDGTPVVIGPDGFDDVEFLFSANPGEEPRPLARIASGGEMSRVMLAIKSVLAVADAMPTMVFDEVDAGIGGEAAIAVASKLANIGKVRQVLAVTHLPQIAAVADNHYAVSKLERSGRMEVTVEKLDIEERVTEVARMLAGEAPSSVTVAHAREMLSRR